MEETSVDVSEGDPPQAEENTNSRQSAAQREIFVFFIYTPYSSSVRVLI